jgi:hypothetical protein
MRIDTLFDHPSFSNSQENEFLYSHLLGKGSYPKNSKKNTLFARLLIQAKQLPECRVLNHSVSPYSNRKMVTLASLLLTTFKVLRTARELNRKLNATVIVVLSQELSEKKYLLMNRMVSNEKWPKNNMAKQIELPLFVRIGKLSE